MTARRLSCASSILLCLSLAPGARTGLPADDATPSDPQPIGAVIKNGSVTCKPESPIVGGLVVNLDEGPLSAAQPSGGGAGRLAGTIAGIAAVAVALTGAAWYARRRWARPEA